MDIRDKIAMSKSKSKIDSSSTRSEDAGDEVVKEKPHVKPKAAPVKHKRVVKPKGAPDKSNVGKRKRLDEDVASEEVDDEEVVSDEDDDDMDERVSDEEGNDVEEGVFYEEDEDYKAYEIEDDKESEEDKGGEKSKKQKHVSDSLSGEEKVSKPKKLSKKKKQVSQSSSYSKDEKPLKNKKKCAKQGIDMKKKTKKPPTSAQIKREKYLSEFSILRPRTVPYSLFSSIRDSQVDMKSFLSDVGFSSLHNIFIDTLPARLVRFVILGVSLGGTSIFDLPEIPLDDLFVKLWFKQFDLKPLKDVDDIK
ncbi:hypothetical protein Tco_0830553 [Tanacetum coccineum]